VFIVVILVDLLTCISLLEDGGAALSFEGSDKRCAWKSALRVHNPKFYWKVLALDFDTSHVSYALTIFRASVAHLFSYSLL